jgi:hypothetical protein
MTNLKCWLHGHDYTMDVFYSDNMQKLKCRRCGMYFGINHSVNALLPWDKELEDMARLIYPEKFTTEK